MACDLAVKTRCASQRKLSLGKSNGPNLSDSTNDLTSLSNEGLLEAGLTRTAAAL